MQKRLILVVHMEELTKIILQHKKGKTIIFKMWTYKIKKSISRCKQQFLN